MRETDGRGGTVGGNTLGMADKKGPSGKRICELEAS